MKEAFIVDGVRTPFLKAGSVAGLNAVSLGVMIVDELLKKKVILKSLSQIDAVIGANIGNQMLPPDGSNVSRLIALKAGIPLITPSWMVSMNCASGLCAVMDAVKEIELGLAECVLVVAVEVMSDYTAAYSREQRQKFANLLAASKAKLPFWKKTPATLAALARVKTMAHNPQWMIQLGLTDPSCDMGMDKVSDKIAKVCNLSREELDLFALESHRRAMHSADKLSEEMGDCFGKLDNGVRAGQNLAQLAKLKPLNSGGVTTAGNSSQVTDGAVAMLIASRDFIVQNHLPTLAKMSSQRSASGGCEPSLMGLGPVTAICNLNGRTDFRLRHFSLVETNEAFASVVLAQSKRLKECGIGAFNPETTNVNGGAIAIGHPISASGARLVLTCAKELQRRKQRYGLVTLCVGGGQGKAAIVENIDL